MGVDDVRANPAHEREQPVHLWNAQQALDFHRQRVEADAGEIRTERVEQRGRRGQRETELRGVEALDEAQHDLLDAAAHRGRQHEHDADTSHASTSRAGATPSSVSSRSWMPVM